jgi:hypothetical protein
MAAGMAITAKTRFDEIAYPSGAAHPSQGSLAPKQFGELISVLQVEPMLMTALHWTGYAHLRNRSTTVEVIIQGEPYMASEAELDQFGTWFEGSALFSDSFQGPNYVWPQDRSWVIVSDMDLVSTYVGTHAPIVELLAQTSLEVVSVELTDPLI